MASKVEIIIEAIDKFKKPLAEAEKGFKKIQTAAREVGKGIKTTVATIAIATGILYGMGKALEAVANRLAALGRKDVADSLTRLKDQLQEFQDQILTLETPIGNMGDILIKFFDGLVTALREIGVMVEIASGGLRLIVVDAQRAYGALQELTGQVTEFTDAWHKAAREQIFASTSARIGEIWEGKLTEAVNKQSSALDRTSAKLQNKRKNLDDLMKAQKGLNDETNKGRQIEDAIRRGDARALADLQSSGGATSAADSAMTAGGGMKANRPGFVASSRNRGDYDFAGGGGRPANQNNTSARASDSQKIGTVIVNIGNKPVMDAAAEVFVDGVKQSQSQGMSGGRKKLGHGR